MGEGNATLKFSQYQNEIFAFFCPETFKMWI
jgi:hypothetical protein